MPKPTRPKYFWEVLFEWISAFLQDKTPQSIRGEAYFSTQGTCAVLELGRNTPGAIKTYRVVPRFPTGFDLLLGCDSISKAREELAAAREKSRQGRGGSIPPVLSQAYTFKAHPGCTHIMWAVWIPQVVGRGHSGGYCLFFDHLSLESPTVLSGDPYAKSYLKNFAKKILEIHPTQSPPPDWDGPKTKEILDALYGIKSDPPLGDPSIRWVAMVSSIEFEKELDRFALRDFGRMHVVFPRVKS